MEEDVVVMYWSFVSSFGCVKDFSLTKCVFPCLLSSFAVPSSLSLDTSTEELLELTVDSTGAALGAL